MPCFNPGPHLQEAVSSVLSQPECLELVVADGGSTDGSLQLLHTLAQHDPRVRVHSEPDAGPADALNKALRRVRGTVIGWLNADDLYMPGALSRACAALRAHPIWLMVYGEGEEFSPATGLRRRYPTLPPEVGLAGFRSHCYLCQPTVVFRRAMTVLLGDFDCHWSTAFDFDYWLRAFATFPQRIGYVPYLQACTRLHEDTITSRQRAAVALEATALLARHFGTADHTRLHNYGLELQLGLARLPAARSTTEHLGDLAEQASSWLTPAALADFRRNWLVDATTAPAMIAAEQQAAELHLDRPLPVRLLQALSPVLRLDAPGPPAGPHTRLKQAVQHHRSAFPLLSSVPTTPVEHPGHSPSVSRPIKPFAQRPFGVNLIGHAYEAFGIGEDVRMAARALQSVGVPCCVIHHPAGNGAACSDRSLESLVVSEPDGPYAFNLVCMAAPIQARWLLQQGLDPLRERYTIAAWPWETQTWPVAWLPLLTVADELWPSSRFTATALEGPAKEASRPLRVMPMAAEITDSSRFSDPAARLATRQQFGLPVDSIVFGYSFDLNSTAIRKNPMGALEAFQRAYPQGQNHAHTERVALMIKTFPPRISSPEWQWLQARASEDARIHLVVESLDRDTLLSLYGCCDVFLSLHRSEGFGRGIAEALQLGLDVITTAFGGNTDFCTGPLVHLVRWARAPIPRGAYPGADGHHWAEPDLEHAVSLIRHVTEQRLQLGMQCTNVNLLAEYRDRFSFASVGRQYRQRLEYLWIRRHLIANNLRWRADSSPAQY